MTRMNAADGHSSEWEYEYDAAETEDVYFTLDLTTHQPKQTSKPSSKAHKQPATRLRSGVAPNGQLDGPLSTQPSPTPAGLPRATRQSEAASREKEAKLQLLDLHADNPLVLFGNTLYTCHWSDTYGSQLYIAPKGSIKPNARPGYVLDVLGLSRAKLVGSPCTIRQRRDEAAPATATSTSTPVTIDEDETDGDVDNVADPPDDALARHAPTAQHHLAALQQQTRDADVKAKTSFLERLSAIKQTRGETDAIPVHGVKDYHISEAAKNEVKQRYSVDEGGAKTKRRHGQKATPNKKRRASAATANANDQAGVKRKKPGPQSSSEVRTAVGLTGTASPDLSLAPSQLSALKTLTPRPSLSAMNDTSPLGPESLREPANSGEAGMPAVENGVPPSHSPEAQDVDTLVQPPGDTLPG